VSSLQVIKSRGVYKSNTSERRDGLLHRLDVAFFFVTAEQIDELQRINESKHIEGRTDCGFSTSNSTDYTVARRLYKAYRLIRTNAYAISIEQAFAGLVLVTSSKETNEHTSLYVREAVWNRHSSGNLKSVCCGKLEHRTSSTQIGTQAPRSCLRTTSFHF
jgi:hypothetical protein